MTHAIYIMQMESLMRTGKEFEFHKINCYLWYANLQIIGIVIMPVVMMMRVLYQKNYFRLGKKN